MHYLVTPRTPLFVIDNPTLNDHRRRKLELSARLGVTDLPDPSSSSAQPSVTVDTGMSMSPRMAFKLTSCLKTSNR